MTTSLITLESPEPTAITLPRMSRPVTAAPLVDFTEQFNIPVNLADWMGQKTLATAVTEVTHAVNERQLQPVFSLNDRRLLHPWAMLTLITYSYAVGLYGSGEIAHRIRFHRRRAVRFILRRGGHCMGQ